MKILPHASSAPTTRYIRQSSKDGIAALQQEKPYSKWRRKEASKDFCTAKNKKTRASDLARVFICFAKRN
jgi:hypothetical protein